MRLAGLHEEEEDEEDKEDKEARMKNTITIYCTDPFPREWMSNEPLNTSLGGGSYRSKNNLIVGPGDSRPTSSAMSAWLLYNVQWL